MTPTQLLPRTVSEKLNEDNRKQAIFEEISLVGFLPTPHPKDYSSR